MMVVIFTVLTLLLNAFVANTCVKVFKVHGYTFAEKDEGKFIYKYNKILYIFL